MKPGAKAKDCPARAKLSQLGARVTCVLCPRHSLASCNKPKMRFIYPDPVRSQTRRRNLLQVMRQVLVNVLEDQQQLHLSLVPPARYHVQQSKSENMPFLTTRQNRILQSFRLNANRHQRERERKGGSCIHCESLESVEVDQ